VREVKARVRIVRGGMNKTEARYARELELWQKTGDVLWWAFEGLTLKLAADTRYTPDFVCVMADGSVRATEIKGFWRDDAKVKIKLAATLFPWIQFEALQVYQGGWKRQSFEPAELPRIA
jgi:hypothetical protein